VQLIEWFLVNDNAHIALVTENMDCGDLSYLLSDPRIRLDLSHVKCIFQQILKGLVSMHQANFMHRDLKGTPKALGSCFNIRSLAGTQPTFF